MPHGDMILGPGYYILTAIYVIVAGAALAVIIDAMRPKRSQQRASLRRAGIKREPLWLFQIFAGLYLLVFIFAQFPATPHWFKAVAIFAIPVMIAFEIAYLLRVVFPKYVTSETASSARGNAEGSSDFDDQSSMPLTSSEEISHDEHH